MRPTSSPPEAVQHLFARQKIADLEALYTALATRSRMTVFRRLKAVGYLSSYSHAGRYYTLATVPEFDGDGLWQHQGVLFSRDRTLKETVVRLVEEAEAGQFHRELALRLRLRVQNTLAELVGESRLGREPVEHEYLYVSAGASRAAAQVARRALAPGAPASSEPLPPSVVIDVLVEVIHGSPIEADAAQVAARLRLRGLAVTTPQVEEVFRRHELVKKTVRSRSRRSGR